MARTVDAQRETERDDEWDYTVDHPIDLEEIENDTSVFQRRSRSSFLPRIEFDREEMTISFSRKKR